MEVIVAVNGLALVLGLWAAWYAIVAAIDRLTAAVDRQTAMLAALDDLDHDDDEDGAA